MTNESTALTTARLALREPVAADASALLGYHVRNDARFAPWEPNRGSHLADHAKWIAWHGAQSAAGRARSWAAFDLASPQTLVALVNLDSITHEPARTAMLSYTVDGAYEGKGYAREAVAAVVAYAFDALGLNELTATFHPDNVRSGGLLERLGFREVARTDPVPGFERLMRAQVLAALARPA